MLVMTNDPLAHFKHLSLLREKKGSDAIKRLRNLTQSFVYQAIW